MLAAGELVVVLPHSTKDQNLFTALSQAGIIKGPPQESSINFAAATKYIFALESAVEPSLVRSLMLANKSYLLAWALRPATLAPVRLIVFDTDSTFINEEVIDELAGYAGLKSHVAAITERAMRGEIDFNAALAERVALLKGLPEHTLDAVLRSKITLTKGAAELIEAIKARGIFTYLLSGGFTFFTGALCEGLGMTGHFANELEIASGHLTGRTQGAIVNRQRKAELLRMLADKHAVPLWQTVAVGDGANDLDMLQCSGLGIAFCAKPALIEACNAAIFARDLRWVGELIF